MKRRLLRKEEDSDPMSVVSNLFDVAMVFAVALMVALVSRYNMTEMFSQEDFTMVKNPGKENMEIITKEGQKINKGEFYQFNLSSCIRQQNSLTAQFVSFSLANLANIFYPPPIFTIINLCLL